MQVLVLGIGNILLQDEGIGVHVVQALRHRYQIPAEVEILDGGTAGMSLLEDLMDKDHVIIIDAVHTGEPPGTVVRLADEAVPVFLQQRISPHQLGLSEVLAALVLADKKPPHLVLIGIVPEAMELSLELTATIEQKLDLLVNSVIAELTAIGVRLSPRSPETPAPHRFEYPAEEYR